MICDIYTGLLRFLWFGSSPTLEPGLF
uniref:Uncharacterized protein n=1 Tax=Anguilla anguilla TaxID=7936 RepID=A0A0E9XYE8_ANGAN